MRKFGRFIIISAVILIFTAVPAFSLDLDFSEIKKTADKFTASMASSLPFNSTMGLNWSDAHIGQFLALPPHFGIGVTAGFTTMEFDSVNTLLDKFGVSLPPGFDWGGFPLPGYTVDARIGGIILPFDVGLKFGMLDLKKDFWDTLKLGDIDFSMNYLLIGGDFRYVVAGKKKASPFKVSLGAGFNYMKGGLSLPVPGASDLSLDFGGHSLSLSSPSLALQWETKAIDLKAQASVKVLIFTPYIGFGATHAWSSAGYGLTAKDKIKVDGKEIDLKGDSAIIKELKKLGLTDITSKGIEQNNEVTGWSLRVFGGFSINIPFIKFDVTGMYDILSSNYGVTLGTRFQL